MTDHLGEDVGGWPSDPYELLAVEPTSDNRALRQAYTRLIRRFKPEHFPEQFRRIREAYETALRRLEYRQYFSRLEIDSAAAPQDSPEAADGLAICEQPTGEPAPVANRQPRLVPKSVTETLDEIWAQVCPGDLPELQRAYRAICQLRLEHPLDEAIFVRLYWLLRVAPELDRQRAALDWLLAGLAQGSPAWMLRELCRAEIERDPSLAFQTEFENLLTASPLDAGALEDLLAGRWLAAARFGRCPTIKADLKALRERWAHRDESLWGRLLVRAAEHVVWTEDEDNEMAWLMAELDTLPHFQTNLAGDLDRVDYLREIAREFHKLQRFGTISDLTLQRLISVWQRPDQEARQMLLELAENCAAGPENALRLFDRIREQGPTLLAGLLTRLDYFVREESPADESSTGDPRDPKALAELVGNFFAQYPAPNYWGLRGRLLRFCVSQAIDPSTVVSIIAPAPVLCLRRGENLSEEISRDVALRCTYALHELVWA